MITELEITNRLQEEYLIKVNELLGFSIDELTLVKSKVAVKNCVGCTRQFRVADFELEEDNVALFWRECQGLPFSSYCAGSQKSEVTGETAYRFCYDDLCMRLSKMQ